MIDTVSDMVMTRDEYNLNEQVKQLAEANLILSGELSKLLKELEIYKSALEKLSIRTSAFEEMLNIDYTWTADAWEDWAIKMGKDMLEVQEKESEVGLYKNALEISCEWNELNLGYLNVDECLQKAREE